MISTVLIYHIYVVYINAVDRKGYSVFDKFGGHPGRTLWYLVVFGIGG